MSVIQNIALLTSEFILLLRSERKLSSGEHIMNHASFSM